MSNLTKKCFASFTEDEELAQQVKRFTCLAFLINVQNHTRKDMW